MVGSKGGGQRPTRCRTAVAQQVGRRSCCELLHERTDEWRASHGTLCHVRLWMDQKQANVIAHALCSSVTEISPRVHRKGRDRALLTGHREYVLQASVHSHQFVLINCITPDTTTSSR
jgi:hypothetical protein